MIVRIMTEGQFELDGDALDALNKIDNEIVQAVAANDESRFAALMRQMHDLVVQRGRRVPADVFVESDLILPPSDATMDEVREMFAGEGIIPG
jgi:DNA-binding GntR family transcriptional regulator